MSLRLNNTNPFDWDLNLPDKRFTLHIHPQILEEIASLAKINRRTVSKEIECAIEAYLIREIDRTK